MSENGNFPDLPLFEDMDFSKNCDAWGEWFTTFILPSPWNSTHYLDGDVRAIFNLFNSSVPDSDTWQRPEDLTDEMYHGLVLDWYGTNYYTYPNGSEYSTENFTHFVVDRPMDFCNKTRCMAFGWSGNMDLVGIGVRNRMFLLSLKDSPLTEKQVFASYYVEAILATILLFTYTYWRFQQLYPSYQTPVSNQGKSKIAQKFILGLQESLQDFLDASKLFSIAMLAAAIYLSGKGIVQRKDWENSDPQQAQPPFEKTVLYDMFLSMLASTFSIFPVMMASTIKGRDPSDSTQYKRRPIWLGTAILTLIWVLSVVEAVMSLYGNIDYGSYHEGDYYRKWAKYHCDWRSAAHYWVGMTVAQLLLVACPLILVLITVFLITGFGIPGVVDKNLVAHCRQLWRLVVAWTMLLAMWGILGFFTWVRHKIDATMGHLNQSNEWGFGQWLALFTWAPFLLHVLTKWLSCADSEQQRQHEPIHNEMQEQSDGVDISTQTRHSTSIASPGDYAASSTLNHEYSYTSLESTKRRRDPIEEWHATGW